MPMNCDRNTAALATLRIAVGLFFVLFGEYKVFGAGFTGVPGLFVPVDKRHTGTRRAHGTR
jgi:uncharacterized membrane protein YphA (DoxX/SURF4 family)